MPNANFLDLQPDSKKKIYQDMLAISGSLTRLFSDSNVPYLVYRSVENAFCEAFGAENLSRSDSAVDAVKNGIGIGIKTFLNANGYTSQKIAEFNRDSSQFNHISNPKELVRVVSQLRNARLDLAKRTYNLHTLVYHCVVRDPYSIMVYETPMDPIDIQSIKGVSFNANQNVVVFSDSKHQYRFNISKSTLYRHFRTENILLDIPVRILDNPFSVLSKIDSIEDMTLSFAEIKQEAPSVFLPLFSDRGGRHVPQRSGLNQWNAKGRPRDLSEVYIPIPAWIHQNFPDFFPDRDTEFKLRLPDGTNLSAKVCQENRKALMTNPNLALGKWLLRKVLNLAEGELLTYEKLEELGIDSVVVYKDADREYSIQFAELGSYDDFCSTHRD